MHNPIDYWAFAEPDVIVPDLALMCARHPEVDNVNLRFTDLHKWGLELPDFADDPNRSNEKILEAIQAAWIEERD